MLALLIVLFALSGLAGWLHSRSRNEMTLPMEHRPKTIRTLLSGLVPHRDQLPTEHRNLPQPQGEAAIRHDVFPGETALGDPIAELAEHFGAPELACPLQAFVAELTTQPPAGLRGVGLVAWESEADPPYLGLYALVDEAGWPGSQPGDAVARETAGAVLKAHDGLNRQLRRDNSPLSCGLWFVKTGDVPAAGLETALRAHLADAGEPFLAQQQAAEFPSRVHVAKAA